jgi:hypothetical protein
VNDEIKSTLESAAFEIRDLRRQRDLLQAKVDGFELAGALLFARVQEPSRGMSEDIAWKCEKMAQRLAQSPNSGEVK